MKPQAFLSASIPIEGRKPFDQDVQIKRIRDAVLALVTVCKDRDMELTFGGHPAISPLVHHAAESLDVIENICIYQSEFYRRFVPEAALKFPRLIWTPAGPDDLSSQAIMSPRCSTRAAGITATPSSSAAWRGSPSRPASSSGTSPAAPMIALRETGGATRLLERSERPDGVNTFPLWPLDPDREREATSTLRYRRLLNDCIEKSSPASGPEFLQRVGTAVVAVVLDDPPIPFRSSPLKRPASEKKTRQGGVQECHAARWTPARPGKIVAAASRRTRGSPRPRPPSPVRWR